ncbi:hypothetical protein GCM10025857_63570 [Alicyclobacillus contaminans]|nr:hypothetical protein GCM10025857_63570 [Alicyclobacillus contaminans]
MKEAVFGKKEEGKEYKARYGAYIVISRREKKEVILVQAPNGAFFLPGGEIEKEETHAETIAREMLEELGFSVQIGAYLGKLKNIFILAIVILILNTQVISTLQINGKKSPNRLKRPISFIG